MGSISSNERRLQRIAEWEERLKLVYKKVPGVEKIDRLLARQAIELAMLELKNSPESEKEKARSKREELLKKKNGMIVAGGLPENICEIWWECNKCQDTGLVAPGIRCSCSAQEIYSERWQLCGLTPEQQGQTFESFSLDWYKDKAKQKENLKICYDFAEKLAEGNLAENLFIFGNVGTGKTHMCSAIAQYILSAGKSVVYLKSGNLLDVLRQQKLNASADEASLDKKIQAIRNADLLIIDDLGTENASDFVREQLLLIIDDRINKRLSWIISTNLAPNEIGAVYEDRLSDRILGLSKIIKFEGESVRRQKKIMKSAQ